MKSQNAATLTPRRAMDALVDHLDGLRRLFKGVTGHNLNNLFGGNLSIGIPARLLLQRGRRGYNRVATADGGATPLLGLFSGINSQDSLLRETLLSDDLERGQMWRVAWQDE